MKFEKLYDGVADNAKTFELINRGYSPDVFSAGQWFECQEDEYWYFLECLPPMDMANGCFSICEFATGNLTNAWVKIGNRAGGERFFCLTIMRRTPEDFHNAMQSFKEMFLEAAYAV